MSDYNNLLLSSKKYRLQRDYWIRRLKDLTVEQIIAQDNSLKKATGNRQTIEYLLPADITKDVIRLGKSSDLAIYLILLSGFNCFLYKYAGQSVLCIGSPACREAEEEFHFNDRIVVKTVITENMTFKEILLNLRETLIEAYDNQEYPFEKIIEELNLLNGQNNELLYEMIFRSASIHKGENAFDKDTALSISYEVLDHNISFQYNFDNTRYSTVTIQNIVKYYEKIMSIMTKNISTKMSEIELLSEEEKEELFAYNNTKTEYPDRNTIQELFEVQVKKTPYADAIRYGNTSYTYEELNTKSNKLAWLLREKGVKQDYIVAILGERTPEIIIEILAVLKAGGAYLPIDPRYPANRINYMLKNSKAALLLTDGSFNVEDDLNCQVLCINDINPAPFSGNDLYHVSKHDSLAYIIYTSGSTGQPKGVMIEQQGLVNYIWWANKVYTKGEQLEFPFYSSISFDLTVTSIFTPLVSGGIIRIYKEDEKEFLIKKIIEENTAQVLKLTPTHLELIKHMDLKNSKIKRLILGGEALKTDLAREVYNKFNTDLEIYNEYGPTETVVGCMIYKYDPVKNVKEYVPIGFPADNVRIYLLDEHLNLVPKGVIGEIYIAGDGVARGYLSNQKTTLESFVPERFSKGGRMYKTGDAARFLPDGSLEYISRKDRQVKVRGYRIELGEIEHEILKHPFVKDTVVCARKDGQGSSYICAYIVMYEAFEIGELKKQLIEVLPDFMIPTYFVRLDELPLSVNSKLNMDALPEPQERMKSNSEYVEPASELEKILAELWSKTLNIKRVGIEDDFFELGGHSLKVTLMIAELNKKIGKNIPLSAILDNPTISKLSNYIDNMNEMETAVKSKQLILLKKGKTDKKNIFLIHAGNGEVENYIEFCNMLKTDFNCWAIKAEKLESYNPKNITIEEIGSCYIKEIRSIQPEGAYYLAGWCVGGSIAFEMARQLEAFGEEISYLALFNSLAPSIEPGFWGDVEDISIKSDVQLVNHLVAGQNIWKDIKDLDKEFIWNDIVHYIETHDKKADMTEQIRRMIPLNISEIIPDFKNACISTLVYYFNMSRTLYKARSEYIPKSKITAQPYFYKANNFNDNNFYDWGQYCKLPIHMNTIAGDHYSIFTKPNVTEFSGLVTIHLDASIQS